MEPSQYQLAQINVARMLAPLDSPRMAGFTNRLAEINALADASPGFVWRLQSDAGDATSVRAYDDPSILVNLSIWESIEALHQYVYRSTHRELLAGRKQWFARFDGPYYALWWVPRGHRPSPEEGKERLATFAASGPTPFAFWFGAPFTPEGEPLRLSADRPTAR